MENLLEAAHQNLVDTIRRRVQYANGLWVEGDGWQLYDIGPTPRTRTCAAPRWALTPMR